MNQHDLGPVTKELLHRLDDAAPAPPTLAAVANRDPPSDTPRSRVLAVSVVSIVAVLLAGLAVVAATRSDRPTPVATEPPPTATASPPITPETTDGPRAGQPVNSTGTPSEQPTVWRHLARNNGEGMAAEIFGTVRYDAANGCFLIEQDGRSYPIVWPAETEPVAQPLGVRLRSGTVIEVGSAITGGGGYLDVAEEFGIPDQCVPSTREVAVFNPNDSPVDGIVSGAFVPPSTVERPELGAADRTAVLAAAARQRIGGGGALRPGEIEVIDVLGEADAGDVHFDTTTPMDGAEREAIKQALAPKSVRFVGLEALELPEQERPSGELLLWLAAPVLIDGQVTVTSGSSCGFLCGTGGAHIVGRGSDGTWVVTGDFGPQWES